MITMLVVTGCSAPKKEATDPEVYRSPLDLAYSPDGTLLAVSDHTAGQLIIIDTKSGGVIQKTALGGSPAGVAWSKDSESVFVSIRDRATVAEIDRNGRIKRRLDIAARPTGLAIANRRGLLLVCDSANNEVVVVEIANGKTIARVAASCQPESISVTADESKAVVGNLLPAGDATDPAMSAEVSLVSLESMKTVASIRLRPNASNIHGTAISADDRWAYVTHNIGRTTLPTSQIADGFINVNGISVIDLKAGKLYATIILDQPWEGAANPWALAATPDGSSLWISFSATHKLARLNLVQMHRWLVKTIPVSKYHTDIYASSGVSTAYGRVELVTDDLPVPLGSGIYLGDALEYVDLESGGPRGIALSPDGRQIATAVYFKGEIVTVDTSSLYIIRRTNLGPQPPPDAPRRGEEAFCDARRCLENWLSCSTCHGQGRADGLNWDLLNDGDGSPKNTRSLLLADRTPPMMAEAVRPEMAVAVKAGVRHILFMDPVEADLRDMEAYIRSMKPEASPWLIDGLPSARAERGRAIFNDERVGCSDCHVPPLFTDLKSYDVGTRDKGDGRDSFDTPTLVEVWRTPPYLHHGRARTLREILLTFNPTDRHGRTSHLTPEEIDLLVEYLKSL